MSDNSISIVPAISSYPDNKSKAADFLNWLIAKNIVKPTLSDCIPGREGGYAVTDGAASVVRKPGFLPFGFQVNGMEIITERQVFDNGGNGIERITCPACNEDISESGLDFIEDWYNGRDKIICPICGVLVDMQQVRFIPEWGFSNLGFTFWNWPEFTEGFLDEIKQKLICEIRIVYARI